jgi:hypothetical protein
MDGYLERDWGRLVGRRWARGNLQSGLGEAADLSSVDLRSVLLSPNVTHGVNTSPCLPPRTILLAAAPLKESDATGAGHCQNEGR